MGDDRHKRDLPWRAETKPDFERQPGEGESSYAPDDGGFSSRQQSLRDRETTGSWRNRTTTKPQSSARPKRTPLNITTRFKKQGGIIALIVAIIGGGAAVTVPMASTVELSHMLETYLQDFDYHSNASSKRLVKLTNEQFKESSVDCKGVKSCQALTTVTDRQAEIYKQAGVTIEREPIPGDTDTSRGRITKMEYTDPSTGEKLTVTNADELVRAQQISSNFDAAMNLDARNPDFLFKDSKQAHAELTKRGVSKADPLEGDDEKSLSKSLDDAASGKKKVSISNKLKEVKDKDGNTTGYTDENGQFLSTDTVEAAKQTTPELDIAKKFSTRTVFSDMAKGATSVIGTASTLCSIRSFEKTIEVLNATAKKDQLIRFFAVVAAVIGKVKALNSGMDIDTSNLPNEVEMLGNRINATNTDQKIADPNSPANHPTFIDNPKYGNSGTDSQIYAMSGQGFTGQFDEQTKRFTFSSKLGGVMRPVDQTIARIINGGDPDTRKIDSKCKIINKPLVQFGGLALGIVTGAVTLGAGTALLATSSVAFSFAKPLLLTHITDLLGNKLVEGLEGEDFGSAFGVGAQAYEGEVARKNGLMPTDKASALQYLGGTKTAQANTSRLEARRAAATPFDITNQYSFLGSFTRTILPYVNTSSRTLGMTALNISGLFSAASSVIVPGSHAADYMSDARLDQCDEPQFKEAGVAADATCLPIYAMSNEAMNLKTSDVSVWMEQSGNIVKGSINEPHDNGQSWNFKKYTDECINDSNDEDPDAWLTDCSIAKGAKNKNLNDHFGAFVMDTNLQTTMSATSQKSSVADTTGFNQASSDGWVFPTTPDAITTSGFGPRDGGFHNGIDLAQDPQHGGAMDKPIFAAREGTVVAAGPQDGFGNWIVIDHGNNLYTFYGHMKSADRGGIMVTIGQHVRAGQQIGRIGNEGNSSGAHLHFGEWSGGNITQGQGQAIDPTADVEKARVAANTRNV